MTGAAAAAAGILLVLGAVLLALGLRRTVPAQRTRARNESVGELWARLTRRPPGRRGRRRDLTLVVSLAAGFVVAAATGWLVALPLVPVLALGLPYVLTVPRPRDIELLEALDRWVRSLSATLGTGKSITDAIRISRRTAPPVLAEDIDLLVVRLNNRWETRDALMRFADTVDSPDADGVIAALILAANRGSNGASTTLQALADSIQAQLRGRRVVEIERSKPYVVVRQITAITLATLILVYLMSPGFFAPYRTGLGQALLTLLLSMYFGSLLLMRRKAQQRRRPRILVGPPR